MGTRPPMPSYSQGPSMSVLAQQQQVHHWQFMLPPVVKQTTLFIGLISAGIADAFLNELLSMSTHLLDIFPVPTMEWPFQVSMIS